MANPEHLEILKRGVDVWNAWRKQYPYIQPHLNDADLSNLDLSHAFLRYTLLGRVNLHHTNLSHADLIGAVLNGSDISHADLSHSKLIANLSYVNLSYAKLNWADLTYANLRHPTLNGADFTNSHWQGTNLVDVDLSEAIGLETVDHLAPSSIGIDTIYKSSGQIPEVFLRGCGLPESFIVQIPALVAALEPIEFYSCFISYSSKDQEFADRLYADLQNKGVRCWFAPEDIKIGDKFRTRIDESIRIYDKLLLVLSENSVSSQWVEKEVETAMEREGGRQKTMLFPISLDDAVNELKVGWPADVRRTRHIGDFTRWENHDSYQKAFDRLLRDLKAEDVNK